ncbi:hypothetical protein CC2G_008765 [Coprinopsis cinerea AmutBmut pab1-1]|nr:hypothetical protein CC2G_008765 [Coprinopsis cinerea AmutBmut pab1-1]
MPVTTIITRHQLNTGLAWIFLAGSSAGTSTTICFLYVLFRFPRFLEHVKAEGADPDVVVRLTTFYQLNCIRVVFRFFFTLPLLIAADSISGPYPIVGNAFSLDFLLMVGGIGCFISSGITLLIFFPRSIAQESGYRAKVISPQSSAKPPTISSSAPPDYYYYDHYDHEIGMARPISALESPTSPASAIRMHSFRFPQEPQHFDRTSRPPRRRRDSGDTGDLSIAYDSDAESIAMTSQTMQAHPIQHSVSQPGHSRHSGATSDDTIWDRQHPDDRRPSSSLRSMRRYSDGPFIYNRGGKITRVGIVHPPSQEPLRRTNSRRRSQLHPYLINFTSPIDLLDGRDDDRVNPV